MIKHIQRAHISTWECNLTGCEGSKSRFQYERFRAHLCDHHDIKVSYSFSPLYAAREGDGGYFSDQNFVACKYCSESRVQPDPNEVSKDDTVF
jgi:hypothetical protein